ncbi:hypothetical protein J1N35_008481 [Gossypium stocksii]|uniref:Uncharacterized protein n=1 Tax=Gossypium stocksii TaxID=47602 RepID=A0A9D3W9D2_9ROSI|nr:hypothetical protein J1N35_008481 [Gossypium stocksii]
MALLITYDEHGGFYDHVPTPVSGVPNPDRIVELDPFYFKFNRLGVRVPTLLVSPWIDKATGEANQYVEDAVKRFLDVRKVAIRAGANESVIVTMRPSLTSRIKDQ